MFKHSIKYIHQETETSDTAGFMTSQEVKWHYNHKNVYWEHIRENWSLLYSGKVFR